MAEYVVRMLRALRAYLWSYLVERLGPRWWGLALGIGLFAYVMCLAHARRTGTGCGRALAAGMLAAYVTVVVSATIFARSASPDRWLEYLSGCGLLDVLCGRRIRPDDLANAAMLMPMGALLPAVTGWRLSRAVRSCVAFSVWIETLQLIYAVGCPDPFDVALNALGAVAGYGLWALATAVRRRAVSTPERNLTKKHTCTGTDVLQ